MSKAVSNEVRQLIRAEIKRHVQQSDAGTVLIADAIACEITCLYQTSECLRMKS